MTADNINDNETTSTEESTESVKPSLWTRSKKYVIGGLIGAGIITLGALALAPALDKNESEDDAIDLDPIEELPVIEAPSEA